jgi:hypothetical protein
MLQLSSGNKARGVPQLSVVTVPAPEDTSLGTLLALRGQNQTLMAEFVLSIAYQPPPLLLNGGPYVLSSAALTAQPVFPSTFASQSKEVAVLRKIISPY